MNHNTDGVADNTDSVADVGLVHAKFYKLPNIQDNRARFGHSLWKNVK